MNFYISDTHFGHQRIIELANRPFRTVDEMDEAMIQKWNSVVTNRDYVFHLGDFSWHGKKRTREIFDRLNGYKTLILGNHDYADTVTCPWSDITNYHETIDNGRSLVLFHYPMMEWNKQYHNSIHLYGHVHGKPKYHKNAYEMCVEVQDYVPKTLDQILSNPA